MVKSSCSHYLKQFFGMSKFLEFLGKEGKRNKFHVNQVTNGAFSNYKVKV